MNNLFKRIEELNGDLVIREAKLDDASGFTQLMNSRYVRQKEKKYFLWRFFFCPTPSILYVVTTKDNRIIGAYGVNIFRLTNGDRCGVTADLIVSDAYTNRGLLYLLENKVKIFARKHNCTYLICFPNFPGMKAHTKIEGWQTLGMVSTLTFIPKKVKVEKKMLKIKPVKNPISFEYNKSLLQWRFDENPEYKYLQIQSDKYQSYIKTFYDTTKKILFGDIVYYTFSPYSKRAFLKLIDHSIKRLQELNVYKVITWCSQNSPCYSIFISLGFVPQIQPRYLCIKPISRDATDPKLFNWQILPGDSEVF